MEQIPTRADALALKASMSRRMTRQNTLADQGASDMLDLPYDILSDNADMNEYLEETTSGVIPKRTISRVSGILEDHELVTFTIRDKDNPKNWSKAYKWYCTMPACRKHSMSAKKSLS
jgi:hypothetical protein